jgi:RHS repeat-associated protein
MQKIQRTSFSMRRTNHWLWVSVLYVFANMGFAHAAQMASPSSMGVNQQGAATYSIPISVPPGIAGMEPKLSLEYNSQANNSLFGVGWNLAGLSAITRCTATIATDGMRSGVNYATTDRFCLDGQRLVLVSGAYGASGSVYRTERDSFSHITANGTQGVGPASFTIKTKSGLIHQYGVTTDSAIKSQNGTSVRVWALNKTSDTVGNYMSVSYTTDAATGSYYPAMLSYTGNGSQAPTNSVQFNYTLRTDQMPLYTAGSMVKNTQLLSSIQTNAGSAMVKKYQLSYQTQTYGSKLSVLTGVQEVLADGSTLPATQVSWPTVLNFANNCTSNCGSVFSVAPQTNITDTSQSYKGWQMLTGDLNNDGMNDMLGYSVAGTNLQFQTWLSADGGVMNKVATHIPVNLGASAVGASVLLGDINGDGNVDLVLAGCNASNNTLTATSLNGVGDGSFGAASTPKQYGSYSCATAGAYRLVDLNADGQSDLIWVDAGATQVNVFALLNNGANGFAAPTLLANAVPPSGFTPANIQKPFYSTDINSDGLPDIVLLYTNGNAIAVQYFAGKVNGTLGGAVDLFSYSGTPGNVNYTYDANYSLQLADLNGDGNPDLIAMGAGASGASADVWMNKGAGYFASVSKNVISSASVNATNWTPLFADVNGDNYVDVVFSSANAASGSTAAYVFFGNGDGNFTQAFGGLSLTGSSAAGATGWNVMLTDLSGKGRADLVAWNPTASGMYTQVWNNAIVNAPTLVSKVSNGLGAYSSFTYSTLSNSAVYTKGSAVNYPQINLTVPVNVVSAVTSPDGVGGQFTTNYSYSGLRAEFYTGRGVLGFAGMTTTQVQAGTTVRVATTFSQSWPYTGLPLTTTKTISSAAGPNHQISLITNTYACLDTQSSAACIIGPNKVYFPYASQTLEQSWDLDGTALPSLVTTSSYDSYGNALQTATNTYDGYTKTTVNTYSNDTTNWLLGRLNQSSVTSVTPAGTLTRTSAFTYNPTTGLLTGETVEPTLAQLCQTTSYTYDGFGNKTGATTANCSGATGTAVFATRSSRNSTAATSTNQTAGQFITSSTNAKGHTETKQYDLRFGGVTQLTGPNGLSTSWLYDIVGRPLQETRADGTQVKYQYLYCAGNNNAAAVAGAAACPTVNGAVGAYVQIATPLASDGSTQNGAISKAYFDAQERQIRLETQGFDGAGVSTAIYQDTQYNNLGQVAAVSRPYYAGQRAYWVQSTFDALGRVVAITQADNTTSTVRYNGLTTTQTNANGQTTQTTKNSQGQIVSVTDANGQMTRYAYDALGNLVTTTDVAGNVISLTYDLRGRKTKLVDPDMGAWTYAYDALGQLVSQTDAKGNVTTMSYDILGRMTARNEADLISNWYFDVYKDGSSCARGLGKLCQATTSTGYNRQISYDGLGRSNSASTTLDAAYTNSVTYDANGRVLTRTYPGGVVLRYGYTALGYLKTITRVSSGAVLWTANTLDAEGHLLQQTYGNAIATTQNFNPANARITSITAGAGNSVQNSTYQYDNLGNVTNRNDQTQSLVETFGYDMLNRMTNSTVNASAAAYTNTYAYSNGGNINSRSDLGGYSYNTVTAPASNSYGCSSGTLTGSGSTATCVTTTSVAANVTYSCPAGQTLSGTNCVGVNNVITPANASYSCAAGATLSGAGSSSTCVTTTTAAASLRYSCPSNATLSGTNCVFTQTTAATPNYSCPAGKTVSGTNCVGSTTSAATVIYSCPSGYALSGSICSQSVTSAANSVNVCPSGFTYSSGSCGAIFLDGGGAFSACSIARSQGFVDSKVWFVAANAWACRVMAKTNYSCPTGSTLSGASCLTTKTVAATPNYSCPSGTLSGSSCSIATSSSATVSYSCPSGQTLSGTSCVNTTTSAATANYSCSAGTLSGSNCVSQSSTAASVRYTCAVGTLQGSNCLLSNNTLVPASASYVCTTGTLSGTSCVVTTSVAAQASYACPSGQTLSGTLCVVAGTVNARPHALGLVQLAGNAGSRLYSYDANGNRVAETWQQGTATASTRSYSYTSFNMPNTFSATTGNTTVSETYAYGPEHQRVKKVSTTLGTTYYLNPGNSGDLLFEKEIKPDNSTELRSYITAGGQVIAVIKQITTAANVTSEQTRYFLRDNLGSTNIVTDENGAVLERLAYEPFGKRRQAAGQQDPNNTLSDPMGQRGFTNHEHLDELKLIHMNGRVYDPMTARFMSADPYIQAPMNSQSYNRYSYGWNSPLNGTDPTGYGWIRSLFHNPVRTVGRTLNEAWHNPEIRTVATIAAAYFTGVYVGETMAGAAGSEWAVASTTYYPSGAMSVSYTTAGGAFAGAASGFASGYVASNGDVNSAFKGAASGATFGAVGGYYGDSWSGERLVANSAAGGISARIYGGDFRDGMRNSFLTGSANWAYTSSVGYKPDGLPGRNQENIDDDQTYKWDELTGQQTASSRGMNVVGNNNSVDFCRQGSMCSRALNVVPGINATAGFHDWIFNSSSMSQSAFNNVWTMLPSAGLSYIALTNGPVSFQLEK